MMFFILDRTNKKISVKTQPGHQVEILIFLVGDLRVFFCERVEVSPKRINLIKLLNKGYIELGLLKESQASS